MGGLLNNRRLLETFGNVHPPKPKRANAKLNPLSERLVYWEPQRRRLCVALPVAPVANVC
jgi:hypothetical protein